MHVEVNGTRLWYDVDGPALVPDGAEMRQRPTVVLIHGGPATYDHSYFKPHFARLAAHVQVVYLDLRARAVRLGRAGRLELRGVRDDIRGFCDSVGISAPIVFGYSLGGAIVLLYGARHPGHAAGLVVQSGFARFDVPRLVEGFRRFGGDEVAELARRSYSGAPSTDEELARVFAVSARTCRMRRRSPAARGTSGSPSAVWS